MGLLPVLQGNQARNDADQSQQAAFAAKPPANRNNNYSMTQTMDSQMDERMKRQTHSHLGKIGMSQMSQMSSSP